MRVLPHEKSSMCQKAYSGRAKEKTGVAKMYTIIHPIISHLRRAMKMTACRP